MPKVKRLNHKKAVHPKSRTAMKISREEHHKQRTIKSKNETKKKKNILIQKLLWFKQHVSSDGNKTVSDDELVTLIDNYFKRFDDELEQIKTKNSIKNRGLGQHFSREQSILMTLENEKDEYNTIGLEIPDLGDLINLKVLKNWNGEISLLPNIKLKRKKMDKAIEQYMEQDQQTPADILK